jgi:DNA primase
MNCNQANEINIAGFLQSIGIAPKTAHGNSFMYCSPFRNEKTASFKVDRVKNVWFDFGTGTGGRLVDLVCQLYRVDVAGALLILSGAVIPEQSFSFQQQNDFADEPKTEIKHIQPIQNKALIQYLTGREIEPDLAAKYCDEIYYNTYTGQVKPYFAIGFKNDTGGYELRNGIKTLKYPKGFKGAISPKDITTIPGANQTAVNVFEGFIDFLSALTYFETQQANYSTIVLNGVGLVDRLLQVLPNYSKINLYLDNDSSGSKTARLIQEYRPDAVNRSIRLYPDCKDFNEFLISIKTTIPR